jgi:arylsulfatase A-like enzyme
MNAIVLTFDRLPVGFLSCYGNNWIATPNFDRLASQSALFDQHFANSPTSDGRANQAEANALPLAKLLGEHGITFRCLVESDGTDTPRERIPAEYVESVHGNDGLDIEPEQTPIFRLVARAQRDLRLLRTSRREPWLLWLKSRGVPSPWLAPRSFATRFLDLDDEQEFDEADDGDTAGADDGAVVEMSDEQLDELLLGMARLPQDKANRDALAMIDRGLMRKVCGGYVALLDAALGNLLDQIEHEAASAPTLLIVTGGQGLTVREPGKLTNEWELLAEETVHAPLFVRLPNLSRGTRRQDLVQTADLIPTLTEWFGVDGSALGLEGESLLPLVSGTAASQRSSAVVSAGQELAGIRTSDFYMVRRRVEGVREGEGDLERRLFAKPEDIWEVHDIAEQSPEVVDELSRQLSETLARGDKRTT